MQVDMCGIEMKPGDYKVCKECCVINWYENDVCRNPDCSCDEFLESKDDVLEWLYAEYRYYDGEGYSEDEIDCFLVEV